MSYEVPAIHPSYGIPTEKGAFNHTHGFTAAAGSEEAHRLTTINGKAMAATALDFLLNDELAKAVREDADQGKNTLSTQSIELDECHSC